MSDDPNSSSQLSEEDLEELRQKIDAVDRKLIDLVNERAELVVDVGKIKRKSGTPIYAPHREQAVLKKVQELNKGPLAAKTVEALYRELMSGSFHLELKYCIVIIHMQFGRQNVCHFHAFLVLMGRWHFSK